MSGHILLDNEWYVLTEEGKRITRRNRSPMAAQISQGAGDYTDLTDFDSLSLSWSNGIGSFEPDDGILFSTAETRYPDRLILPAKLEYLGWGATLEDLPDVVDSTTTLSATGNVRKVAILLGQTSSFLSAHADFRVGTVRFLLDPFDSTSDTTVNVELWTGSASAPTTQQETGSSLTIDHSIKGPRFYSHTFTYEPSGTGVFLWAVLSSPPNGITIPASTESPTVTSCCTYDGSAWSSATGVWSMIAVGNPWTSGEFGGDSPLDSRLLVRFQNKIISVTSEDILEYDWSTGVWSAVGVNPLSGYEPWAAVEYNDELYLGYGSDGVVYKLDSSYTAATSGVNEYANGFTIYNGYLVKWYLGDFAYTTDGSTWTTVVGRTDNSGWQIRGAASMDGSLYLATDDALWRNDNDWSTLGISPWPGPDENAGKGSCAWQGSIYLPFGRTVYRYDSSGALFPMGPDREAGLIHEYGGEVTKLVPTNNYLLAVVRTGYSDHSSVWAWDGTGWHFVAHLAVGEIISDAIYYREDADSQYLYILGENNTLMRVSVPDSVGYQLINETPDFEYGAWIETDWWNGRLAEVNKDPVSVYVAGENISSNVTVYYQADNDTYWTKLGVIASSGTYLTWPDVHDTFKRIRLGVRIDKAEAGTTPVIHTIVFRYQPMFKDLYRWFISIAIEEDQRMADGSVNRRDTNYMTYHLDQLINRETPFDMVDTDGSTYRVKVSEHARVPTGVDYEENKVKFAYGLNLTIDQHWED